MMKLRNFFYRVAWLNGKDCNKATLRAYGVMVIFFGALFLLLWASGTPVPKAVVISFGTSFGMVILSEFIAISFFSGSKNWLIAILNAKKLVEEYPEYIAYFPEYLEALDWRISQLRAAKTKDPSSLNRFVQPYKDLFQAMRSLKKIVKQGSELFELAFEAQAKIKINPPEA